MSLYVCQVAKRLRAYCLECRVYTWCCDGVENMQHLKWHRLGFVELCAKILQIMRNDLKIMHALFVN